ncbi:hypothetical protein SDC9_64757 [bioreactor metagenome]|uniref:Uncharacterized protein n=1 Tax=bioreactor metagenome TaxID=1076179 RepID=A0A644XRE7_9ZZZZ
MQNANAGSIESGSTLSYISGTMNRPALEDGATYTGAPVTGDDI